MSLGNKELGVGDEARINKKTLGYSLRKYNLIPGGKVTVIQIKDRLVWVSAEGVDEPLHFDRGDLDKFF